MDTERLTNPPGRDKPRDKRKRYSHTDAHRSLVARYASLGYQRHRFIERLATSVVGHSCHSGCRCEPCEECADKNVECGRGCWWHEVKRGLREAFPCVPDAWRIDEENADVYCVEVDVTHHTSDEKLASYMDLWFELDSHEAWGLTVILVDRFGVERRFGQGGLPLPSRTAA